MEWSSSLPHNILKSESSSAYYPWSGDGEAYTQSSHYPRYSLPFKSDTVNNF